MKKLFLILVAGISLAGCTIGSSNLNGQQDIQVVASFYPLGYLAEQIAGEHLTVETIVPVTTEPHDYTPTPQDIVKVTQADIFIYNGGGFDAWAESIPVGDFVQPAVQHLEAMDLVALLPALAEDNEHADEVAGHEDEHGEFDPHVWLDPILLQTLVTEIQAAYTELDPAHAADYQKNAEQLIAKLDQLDRAYQTGLQNCEIRQAIVAHDAFGYLSERYDIEFLPIVGLNPNETPSAQTIAQLSNVAREHQINYIFFEELTSPKLSEVLASEVGANTLVLSPLEGLSVDGQAAGADYFTMMEQNLSNLRLALRCQ